MPISIAQLLARQPPKEIVVETLKQAKLRGEGLSRKDILHLGFGYRLEDMTGNFQEWNYDLTPTPANLYTTITYILKDLINEGLVRTDRIGYSRWYYWV